VRMVTRHVNCQETTNMLVNSTVIVSVLGLVIVAWICLAIMMAMAGCFMNSAPFGQLIFGTLISVVMTAIMDYFFGCVVPFKLNYSRQRNISKPNRYCSQPNIPSKAFLDSKIAPSTPLHRIISDIARNNRRMTLTIGFAFVIMVKAFFPAMGVREDGSLQCMFVPRFGPSIGIACAVGFLALPVVHAGSYVYKYHVISAADLTQYIRHRRAVTEPYVHDVEVGDSGDVEVGDSGDVEVGDSGDVEVGDSDEEEGNGHKVDQRISEIADRDEEHVLPPLHLKKQMRKAFI